MIYTAIKVSKGGLYILAAVARAAQLHITVKSTCWYILYSIFPKPLVMLADRRMAGWVSTRIYLGLFSARKKVRLSLSKTQSFEVSLDV